MATIFRLRYWDDGNPVEQNYAKERDARNRHDELLGQARITNIELFRQRTMRPSLKTMIRILNGEPYVYEQKRIAVSRLSTSAGGG